MRSIKICGGITFSELEKEEWVVGFTTAQGYSRHYTEEMVLAETKKLMEQLLSITAKKVEEVNLLDQKELIEAMLVDTKEYLEGVQGSLSKHSLKLDIVTIDGKFIVTLI